MLTAFDINLYRVKSKGSALSPDFGVWELMFHCPCGEFGAIVRVMIPRDACYYSRRMK